jgi:hypothetical protein
MVGRTFGVAGQSLRQRLDEALEAIAVLRAENESLRDRIAHLEAELGKNSSNSSKPPSADPVEVRKKRAERRGDAERRSVPRASSPALPAPISNVGCPTRSLNTSQAVAGDAERT